MVNVCPPLYALIILCTPCSLPAAPQPGEVYREYATHNGGNRDWRVTDPEARAAGAKAFLPNPVLQIAIDDLEHAVRAEAVLDRWGGHLKTTDKRIRFNGGEWLSVPEIATAPPGRAEYYYAQDNPGIDLPLSQLKQGVNTFEGTCGVRDGYNWGQWGLYSLIVRVYYDPAAKEHPGGRIIEPAPGATLGENPRIVVEPISGQGVARVDVLAWYDGYDEDGDGVFADWHGAYFQPYRGAAADLREHVGTAWRSPWQLTWNTHWVPDQPPRSIKLIARVQDIRGLWYVTPVVGQLSLARPGVAVKMYPTPQLPEAFGVRVNRTKTSTIPITGDDPTQATAAVLALRTWHGWDGHHQPLQLNDLRLPIAGKNHHYDYDLLPIPPAAMRAGDNTLTIRSATEHHMLEVLWPGPALIIRYAR